MSANPQDVIDQEVKSNPIMLYMKGTPDFPQCGFSARVAQAIQSTGVAFASRNVFEDEVIYRQGVKDYSNWPTFPQLYVNGELLGGCDIIMDMYESGELETLLSEAAQ